MKILFFALASVLLFSGCQPSLEKPFTEVAQIETSPTEPTLVTSTAPISTPAQTSQPSSPEPTPEVLPTATPVEELPFMTENMSMQKPKLSNEKKSWYFNKNKNHTPPTAQIQIRLEQYNAYYLGDTNEKVVYLTFDEGYENGFTAPILDTLKEKEVPAAFFLTKSYIKNEPELVKRMVTEGHVAANHSSTHPSFPSLSDQQVTQELQDTALYFESVTGQKIDPFFRPPMGEYSERTLYDTNQQGYKTIFWSFAYKDWLTDNQPGKDVAYNTVMDNLHNGSIILLHAVSESNTEALPQIIDSIREQGYTFKSLYDLPTY